MSADAKRGERIGFVATEDEKNSIEVAARKAGVSLATFTRNATLREALDVATTIPDLADKLIGTVEPMPVEYHAGMLAEILQGWGMLPVGTQYTAQELTVVTKLEDGSYTAREVLPVAFVPLTGDR